MGSSGRLAESTVSRSFSGEEDEVVRTRRASSSETSTRCRSRSARASILSLYLRTWKSITAERRYRSARCGACPYTCRWCSRAVYGDRTAVVLRRLSSRRSPRSASTCHPGHALVCRRCLHDQPSVAGGFRRGATESRPEIPYECITRADRLNDRPFELLKESGCFRVWIGAESGSQKVLDAMDRRVTVEQVRSMIQLSKRMASRPARSSCSDNPGETEEDIEETIEHLKRSDPDHYTVTVAYPITGTPLFEDVSEIITHFPGSEISPTATSSSSGHIRSSTITSRCAAFSMKCRRTTRAIPLAAKSPAPVEGARGAHGNALTRGAESPLNPKFTSPSLLFASAPTTRPGCCPSSTGHMLSHSRATGTGCVRPRVCQFKIDAMEPETVLGNDVQILTPQMMIPEVNHWYRCNGIEPIRLSHEVSLLPRTPRDERHTRALHPGRRPRQFPPDIKIGALEEGEFHSAGVRDAEGKTST